MSGQPFAGASHIPAMRGTLGEAIDKAAQAKPLRIARYAVRMKHDSGKITIRTWARSVEAAIGIVLKAENAPRRAVISCREDVPRSKSGIARALTQAASVTIGAWRLAYNGAEERREGGTGEVWRISRADTNEREKDFFTKARAVAHFAALAGV